MNKSTPTPLKKTRAFEDTGLSRTYIKDESVNPFGTIKDRRSAVIINEANRLKVDKLVLITAGNNGFSLAKMAENSPVKVVCIVNRGIKPQILDSLREVSYQVIELNLNEKILRPEEIIAFARERDDEVIWDVTNGYEESYTHVVREIFDELESVDYVIVPLGSGGIFMGIVQGIKRLNKSTKVIGVGTQDAYQSVADKLSTPWTPYSKAIENYVEQGHKVIRLSEQEIKSTYEKYQNLVSTEPSSSVVFIAPDKIEFKEEDAIVFVNSGKSLVDQQN